MLVRKYVVGIETGSDDRPFIIRNAAPEGSWVEPLDDPDDDELAMPGLRVRPLLRYQSDPEVEVPQDFYIHLTSGFVGQSLPPEILEAFAGRSKNWKIVRCVPQEEDFLFVLVNPEIYKNDFDTYSLKGQLENGYTWALLKTNDEGYHEDLEILAPNGDGTTSRYVLSCPDAGEIELIEYRGDKIFRSSEWKCNGGCRDNGWYDEIIVTEFL